MSHPTKKLITVAAAGHELGVSEATVWRLIRKGSLPSLMKGGRRLVLRKALQAKSVRRRVGTVPPLTKDHPIFQMIGAGRSGGHGPGARDKHKILSQ